MVQNKYIYPSTYVFNTFRDHGSIVSQFYPKIARNSILKYKGVIDLIRNSKFNCRKKSKIRLLLKAYTSQVDITCIYLHVCSA